MANNSSSGTFDGSLFLGEPYLLWVQFKLFPYMVGINAVLTALLGVPFNIAYLKIFVSTLTGHIRGVLIVLTISDFATYVFVLAPVAYISFAQVESLSGELCTSNGASLQVWFGFQFSIILYGLVTSIVGHVKGRVIESGPCGAVFVTAVSFSSVTLLALVPLLLQTDYIFLQSEYGCYQDRNETKELIHTSFVVFIYIPSAVAIICFILMLQSILKKKRAVESKDSDSDVGIMEIEDETATQQENTTSQNVHGLSGATSVSTFGTSMSSNFHTAFLHSKNSKLWEDEISEHTDELTTVDIHQSSDSLYRNSTNASLRSEEALSEHDTERVVPDMHAVRSLAIDNNVNHNESNVSVDRSLVSSASNAEKTSATSGIGTNVSDENEIATLEESESTKSDNPSKPRNEPLPSIRCNTDESLHTAVGETVFEEAHTSEEVFAGNASNLTKTQMNKNYSLTTTISESNQTQCSSSTGYSLTDMDRYIELMKAKYPNGRSDFPPFPPKLYPSLVTRSTAVSKKASKSKNGKSGDAAPLLSDIIFKTVQDEKSAVTHHMAQYLVLWFCTTVCWIPHVILVYINMSGADWWDGWFSVAVMCTHWSYCIKPLIMLGIRRQLTKSGEVMLPKKIHSGADTFRSAVKKVMNNIDNGVFRSKK